MESDSALVQRRRKMLRLWGFLCVFVLILILFPVRNEFIRVALLAEILGIWGGALLLFWKRLPVRAICLFLPVALGTLFLSSRPNVDAVSLRGAYVISLRSYAGTPYIWGGETSAGIDCSGLVRQGMINAEWVEGLRTFNGALLREAFSLWWNDCSARALGEEYRGRTILQQKLPTFNNLEYQQIQPGDLAVIGDGVHVLAYLGGKDWIQADPQAGWVIITPVPSNDPHLAFDATIVRWRILTPPPR